MKMIIHHKVDAFGFEDQFELESKIRSTFSHLSCICIKEISVSQATHPNQKQIIVSFELQGKSSFDEASMMIRDAVMMRGDLELKSVSERNYGPMFHQPSQHTTAFDEFEQADAEIQEIMSMNRRNSPRSSSNAFNTGIFDQGVFHHNPLSDSLGQHAGNEQQEMIDDMVNDMLGTDVGKCGF